MENDKIFIDINPKKKDIKEILIWLEEEKNNSGSSFYSNKNIIEKAFEDGNSIALKKGKKDIGLIIWSGIDEIRADIDIFVIHPDYRAQGLGRFYYNETLKFFKIKGFKAVKLFCSPEESKYFWEKMGFIRLPECGRTENELTYYTILVDTASIENLNRTNKIELWDVEPYEANEQNPKWIWYVKMKDGVLSYPIIQPCNCNWNLRWSKNGKVIREGKVKYFTNKDFELYFYPFLYIDELQE